MSSCHRFPGLQPLQVAGRGHLDVEREAIGQLGSLLQGGATCARRHLQMHVALVGMAGTKQPDRLQHPPHRRIRGAVGGRAEQQPVHLAPPLQRGERARQLFGREGGPLRVVAATQRAIGAVLLAAAALQDAEQGPTLPPVGPLARAECPEQRNARRGSQAASGAGPAGATAGRVPPPRSGPRRPAAPASPASPSATLRRQSSAMAVYQAGYRDGLRGAYSKHERARSADEQSNRHY